MSIINEATRQALIAMRADPSRMQRLMMTALQKGMPDVDIVSANCPFVLSQESTVMNASAFMTHTDSIIRRVYPSLAITEEEIYPHITDALTVERYAQPATCPEWVLMFSLDELKTYGVTDPKSGATRILIPNTSIFYDGTVEYGIYYYIEIIILKNGGIKVTWQGEFEGGLKEISTNVVDFDIYKTATQPNEILRIFFPADQYSMNTSYLNMDSSGANTLKVALNDDFYVAQVWNNNPITGKREKVYTTFSDQVYDPTILTAFLKVADSVLTVVIPPIYANMNSLGSQLRVDVYTTKGAYSHDPKEDTTDMFSYAWRDVDKDYSEYIAPLAKLSTVRVAATGTVYGGRNALTTDELRNLVILNGNEKTVPITPRDRDVELDDYGLTLTTIKDNVTERQYLTSKPISAPTEITNNLSAAGIYNPSMLLDSTVLKALETVTVTSERLTILPTTLFEAVDGVVSPVSDVVRNALDVTSDGNKVELLNASTYLYTPFHYVMDTTNSYFTLGAYYLDYPTIEGRYFIEDNDTVPYLLAPYQYSFTKVDEGYRLQIVLTQDEGLSSFRASDGDVFCQIGFIPNLGNSLVYQTGTYIGVTGEAKQPVFQFDLNTEYVIDRNDALYLEGFEGYEGDVVDYPTLLLQEFEVYCGLYNWKDSMGTMGITTTTMDNDVGADLLAYDEYLTLSHETIKLQFGSALTNLFRPTRSVMTEGSYKTYEEDVLSYYPKTVLETDPATGLPTINMDNPEDPFTVLHAKGDPVLDDEGNQVVLYPKGSIMLDQYGLPIPATVSEIAQQATLVMLDGKYRYSTDPNVQAYMSSIPLEIVSILEGPINEIQAQLIGDTDLYMAPQNTMGDVTIFDGNLEKDIDARQNPTIELWTNTDNYKNGDLRTSIEKTCKEIYIAAIGERKVMINAIQKSISDTLSEDIMGVKVSGLGPNQDLHTVTVEDQTSALALNTILAIRADGLIIVEDDIEFKWYDMGDS